LALAKIVEPLTTYSKSNSREIFAIILGLEKIFSPVTVSNLSESDSQAVASEPSSAKRHREVSEDRVGKLRDGRQVLHNVICIAVS